MNSKPFVIERTFNAPIEKVWKAITDKDQMKEWYFDLADFKAEVGFSFRFVGGEENNPYWHQCVITEIVKGKKLSYSWEYEGYKGSSVVTFELFPEGDKTRLKLTHAGLESFAINNNPDLDTKNFIEGWNHIIDIALKEYVEKA